MAREQRGLSLSQNLNRYSCWRVVSGLTLKGIGQKNDVMQLKNANAIGNSIVLICLARFGGLSRLEVMVW